MAAQNRGKEPERVRRPWLPSDRALDAIDRAVAEGFFDNLPGKGQPLDFSDDDNPYVPDDMRMAYRILRNAGVRPPWIEERKIIDARRSDLERQIQRHSNRIQAEIAHLDHIPAYLRPSRLDRLRADHASFLQKTDQALDDLNKKINLYNLSVPVVSAQIFPLDRQKFLAAAAIEFPPQT